VSGSEEVRNKRRHESKSGKGALSDEIDIAKFLRNGDQRELTGLTPEYKDRMNQMKSVYDALGAWKDANFISGKGVVLTRNKAGISDAANAIIDDMLQPKSSGRNPMPSGSGKAADALLSRDLKKVYRELFGEIKDPVENWAVSREIQSQNINRLSFMSDVYRTSGIIRDTPSKTHSIRLGSSQDVGAKVTTYDRRRYGQSAGKWVTPQTAAEMRLRVKKGELEQVTSGAIKKIMGFQRMVATSMPSTIFRDAISNILGNATAAGDVSPTFLKHYLYAHGVVSKLALGRAGEKISPKWEADARRLLAYMSKEGIYRHGASSMTADLDHLITGEGSFSRGVDSIGRARSLFADMTAKYAGYKSRLELLQKWNKTAKVKKSDQQLKAEARKHLADLYDNRDAIPMWFKRFAQIPGNFDYLEFKYSNTRNYINAWRSLAADMANPDIPKRFKLKRLFDMGVANTAQAAIAAREVAFSSAALDGAAALVTTALAKVKGHGLEEPVRVDSEIEDAFRDLAPYYYKDASLTYHLDKNNKIVQTVYTGGATPFTAVDMATGWIDAGSVDFSKTGRAIEQVAGATPMFTKFALGVAENTTRVFKEMLKEAKYYAQNEEYDGKTTEYVKRTLSQASKEYLGKPGKMLVSSTGFDQKRDIQRTLSMLVPNAKDRKKILEDSKKTGKPLADFKIKLNGKYVRLGDYMSPRSKKDVNLSSVVPFNTTVYTPENYRNILLKTFYYNHPSRDNKKFLDAIVLHSKKALGVPNYGSRLGRVTEMAGSASKIMKLMYPDKNIKRELKMILDGAGYSKDDIRDIIRGIGSL